MGATLGKDAGKQIAGGFVGGVLRNKLAFTGGFEDGGFIALEVGLQPLEGGDARIKPGELRLKRRDDAALLVQRRERDTICA